MEKTILGLDLGTNSIGWALIKQDFENKKGEILGMGSRIIPMSQDIIGDFGKGNSISQTADRTKLRGVRRLRERHLLRRERIHRVLNILGFLPEHYSNQIDFEKNLGKFIHEAEPKLVYDDKSFIFKQSFDEMLNEFKKHQPEIVKEDKKVPYDWTIYYLRKKALTQKIEKEELAWILLNFNQKRGYYQLRGEEEDENPNKLVEFYSLKIIEILADEPQKGKSEIWYSLVLENGWVYRRSSKTSLFDWKDKTRDFIVTTDLNDDGTIKTDKEGTEKRSFRAPSETDWTLVKKKTEQEINLSTKTVGSYIYDTLLKKPNQKIKGKLVRTIERKFYKDELNQILSTQQQFHPELQNTDLYTDCVRELYRNNEAHQMTLGKKNFVHLFLEDIIFYQRPLKSKKSAIGNCTLEFRKYKKDGETKTEYLKAIPKSHPLYQEFRLWQWMYNLSIYKTDDETNVTSNYINNVEDYENLFQFLNCRKEVDQKAVLKHFKLTEKSHRWNFVKDKKYPCNETKTQISTRLAKTEGVPIDFLTTSVENQLWHIIYSVNDKLEYEKALDTFAKKNQLESDSFVENFRKFPPFKSEYGTYSEKAIKKLLPLIRIGKYWNWDEINEKTKERINKILTGEYDESIRNKVREKAIQLSTEKDFQGLQLWLANYIVYDRHSEAALIGKWNSIEDLDSYLDEFKQHSLRNPIVEQVITETLRVVKDIWLKHGNGIKDFFTEIHIELGREMKNTADDRKKITEQITLNENTNLRITSLLAEMQNDATIENVRSFSQPQKEILRIYEDGVLNSNIEIPDDIEKISKTAQPSKSDLQRYKLWLEQKYRSPYTGQPIPISKLFTNEYEIEHIIPQSRFFDDSFSNKVICESAVNSLKGNLLGLEFIKNYHGQIVELGFGKSAAIFEEINYEQFVKEHYAKSRGKLNKLMLEDIPEKMIERQLNDTRYISKFISSTLSNIVRSETNDDGVNSKNIIPGNGKITTALKQDWGLNDVWNDLILPRFERMNEITNSKLFTTYNDRFQKYLPTVPLELSKGFQKKRIDHRHHAMDALVIACATGNHVNLLNNKHAKSTERFDLNRKLRRFELASYFDKQTNKQIEREVPKDFLKPWATFTVDAKNCLEKIIVSFKQNIRVINKTTNRFESYKDENGNLRLDENGKPKKDVIRQTKGDSWAIRKPMHKDTVSGRVQLKRIKTVSLNNALDDVKSIVNKQLRFQITSLFEQGYDKKKISNYFKELNNVWNNNSVSVIDIYIWETENVASRVNLDISFNEKRITDTITDTGIQKILLKHLANYKGNYDEKGKEILPELLAFTPEGIEEMNISIHSLKINAKNHQPIFKVRTYETKGNKFPVGHNGTKSQKFVEAAKGTNLFFAIYQDEKGKRNYETIPLNEVIEHQKWRGSLPSEEQVKIAMIPIKPEKGQFLFYLSPNDLVLVSDEDNINTNKLKTTNTQEVYKMVSSSGNQCFFIQASVATSILDKSEFSALNKMEKDIKGNMIKSSCIKLKIDRIGNISKA